IASSLAINIAAVPWNLLAQPLNPVPLIRATHQLLPPNPAGSQQTTSKDESERSMLTSAAKKLTCRRAQGSNPRLRVLQDTRHKPCDRRRACRGCTRLRPRTSRQPPDGTTKQNPCRSPSVLGDRFPAPACF